MKPLAAWGRNLDSLIRQEKEKQNKIKAENDVLEAKQRPKAKKSNAPAPVPTDSQRPYFKHADTQAQKLQPIFD